MAVKFKLFIYCPFRILGLTFNQNGVKLSISYCFQLLAFKGTRCPQKPKGVYHFLIVCLNVLTIPLKKNNVQELYKLNVILRYIMNSQNIWPYNCAKIT